MSANRYSCCFQLACVIICVIDCPDAQAPLCTGDSYLQIPVSNQNYILSTTNAKESANFSTPGAPHPCFRTRAPCFYPSQVRFRSPAHPARYFFVSLHRTKVHSLRAEGILKGKPVKVRNCARSCELLNGPVMMPLLLREGAAPGAVRRPALSSLT